MRRSPRIENCPASSGSGDGKESTGSNRSDRKLHFRSILDYTTYQDPLMRRFGVQSLRMAILGGGPGSVVVITGIRDCEQVRDMLSGIDRMRENG